jgi:deoxyribonuclease V
MQINVLHSWDVSFSEAVRIQKDLRQQIRLEALNRVQYIAGADVSYDIGSDQFYAGVIVVNFPDLQPVEESVAVGKAPFPYVPGLLSFREAPILLQAFEQLTGCPDVIIFDGHGIAHPRGIGIASHAGLFLDCPSVGCAKSKLTGMYDERLLGEKAGSVVSLYTKDDLTIGSVVRTKDRVKPVFVSPGHKADIPSSIKLVLDCCKGFKLPEPTRLAHTFVNRVRRQNGENTLS